jgi:hypothetical protein
MRASPDVVQAISRGTLAGKRAGWFQRRPRAPDRLPSIASAEGDLADDLGTARGIAIALAISVPIWAAIIALCWATGYWL